MLAAVSGNSDKRGIKCKEFSRNDIGFLEVWGKVCGHSEKQLDTSKKKEEKEGERGEKRTFPG